MLSLITVINIYLKLSGAIKVNWFWVFFPTILEVLSIIATIVVLKYYV